MVRHEVELQVWSVPVKLDQINYALFSECTHKKQKVADKDVMTFGNEFDYEK